MLHSLLISLLIFTYPAGENKETEFSLGLYYSHYGLYGNGSVPSIYAIWTDWRFGAEIGVANFVPNIGLKIRCSSIKYYSPFEEWYEYIPLTLCTSFDLLPFLKLKWLRLSAETGFGVYFWKGIWIDQVIVLPNGEKMKERDIGFVGGLTLQLKPHKFIGLEFSSYYHYIASSDLEKYGYFDKDEKLWENGVGLKIIIPW